MAKLFGTNGIRGVVNVDLTPAFVAKMGTAIGTFLRGGRVLVGRDGRTSGEMVESAMISSLVSTGCRVYRGGMAPTPAHQFGTRFYKMDGGVILTASHNPPEYNGIKVIGPSGVEISRSEELEIERVYFDEGFKMRKWDRMGSVEETLDVIGPYKDGIKSHVNVDAIKKAHLNVVTDLANGVGALVIPDLLRELGCRVVEINSTVNGRFPGRPPEPRPEYLGELASMVREKGADLGFACDGDADRAIFTDEKGEIYWGDKSFALIERMFLSKNPGEKVVTPVSSSRIVEDVASEFGGEIVWTRVGSVDVSWKMVEIGANLGAEENGGVFYGPHQPLRDAAMAIALILEIMAEKREPLSQLMKELPTYYQAKDKVPCPHELKSRALEELRERVRAERIETIDGLKLWFEDESWILIRPSGTEPLYRLYAEAKTPRRVKQIVEDHKRIVQKVLSEL